jgi:GNAT superfamily N-acetyltransferase
MGAFMFEHRIATRHDIPALTGLMRLAIDELQNAFLTQAEVAASRNIMGLDTQLIKDGTYFVIVENGGIIGAGGWSMRATLYGGDHSTDLRDPGLLDPKSDAARLRAMYTDPRHARRGVGRQIVRLCEDAARAAGFSRIELMGTLAGEPLYRSCGYVALERLSAPDYNGIRVPLVRMGKIF